MSVNVVSRCCNREIVVSTWIEHMEGGWKQIHKADTCSGCGMMVKYPVEKCDVCKEVGCYGECESDCMD